MKRATLGCTIVLTLALLATASATVAPSGASAAQVIAILNAERAANGLPANLTENPEWSADCKLHVAYMELNDVLSHPEDSSKPGYSVAGNWAGSNAVLADSSTFAGGHDPFESAPYHLGQVMAPGLTTVGAYDDGRYACVTTWPGTTAPSPSTTPTFYSYPGPGATGVPVAERADELPSVPGDLVGLPSGTTTGPYLIVYASGFSSDTTVQSAALQPDQGAPVEIRSVPDSDYEEPGTTFLIPVQPLAPHMHYTATVTFADPRSGATATDTFGFTTVDPPRIEAFALPAAVFTRRAFFSGKVTVTTSAPVSVTVSTAYAPVGGSWRSAGLTLSVPTSAGALTKRVMLAALIGSSSIPPGRYRITASTDGNTVTRSFRLTG